MQKIHISELCRLIIWWQYNGNDLLPSPDLDVMRNLAGVLGRALPEILCKPSVSDFTLALASSIAGLALATNELGTPNCGPTRGKNCRERKSLH